MKLTHTETTPWHSERRLRARTHARARSHTHTHKHARTHARTHACARTHTHTHTHRDLHPTPIPHKHPHTGGSRALGSQERIAPTRLTQGRKNIYNNNGQPGGRASFSVNGLNEPEILLSLWASKLIQTGQISGRTKSVSARSPLSPLWRSCRTL